MKKIVGVKGAYRMLGREGENKKLPTCRSSGNNLNGLILNWCTGGRWFTLAHPDPPRPHGD
jgi:hypothetical protein